MFPLDSTSDLPVEATQSTLEKDHGEPAVLQRNSTGESEKVGINRETQGVREASSFIVSSQRGGSKGPFPA